MLRIFNIIRRMWRAMSAPFIMLKDKAAGVEVYRKYANQDWAQRHPKTQHDLDAPKVNANVYIATRAISDAIKGLPVYITQKEMVRGAEREIEDVDHPATELLRNPNPEHSWSDIVDHIVKSYLNDGNAILTIERLTGPNQFVEIWPRDPRSVDISTKSRHYRFGKYTPSQKAYPRNRVIHIRDMDVDDPFWGIGRVNTVREEIMMDYFVNRFNSNFFRYGATLNLMFTPDHDLTEDQHMQILDAMSAEVGGAERAFRIFINKYAGKFEYPDQKHKEIAFLDLLKHNREKIFGVFGLPPFRGGVMEYANYANALAQDKDFWNNTVAPILKVIEDAINKQLLWPIFGPDTAIKFDLDSVPAIKGDQTEIEDRLLKLKDKGIVSAEYVREQLGIDESAAPKVPDALKPTATPADGEDPQDGEDQEDKPTQQEQGAVENALFKLFKLQRDATLQKLLKMTCGGSMMSILCDPETQVPRVYDTVLSAKSTRNTIIPLMRSIVMERGIESFADRGVFSMDNDLIHGLMRRVVFKIEDIIEQNVELLNAVILDADRYGWTYRQLEQRVKRVFSYDRAHELSRVMVQDTVNSAKLIFAEMKHKSGDSLEAVLKR